MHARFVYPMNGWILPGGLVVLAAGADVWFLIQAVQHWEINGPTGLVGPFIGFLIVIAVYLYYPVELVVTDERIEIAYLGGVKLRYRRMDVAFEIYGGTLIGRVREPVARSVLIGVFKFNISLLRGPKVLLGDLVMEYRMRVDS